MIPPRAELPFRCSPAGVFVVKSRIRSERVLTLPTLGVLAAATSGILAVPFAISALSSSARSAAPQASRLQTGTSQSTISIIFHEDFDDDELGAVPIGVDLAGGAVLIENDDGFVEGSKSGPSTLLNVVREDSSDIGNCLAIGDLDATVGATSVSFVPARGMSGVPLDVRFDLRREMGDPSSDLILCAIDNRTTPGTGRMFTMAFKGSAGDLELGGKSFPFSMDAGVTYSFEIHLDLDPGPFDSWDLTITSHTDATDRFELKDLRTTINVTELSLFHIAAISDVGLCAYLDNFEIQQTTEN